MEELRDVLERVEGKLVVVRYVHAAIAFVYWVTVLAIFYTVVGVVGRVEYRTALAFWLISILFYYPIWNRSKRLLGLNFRKFALKVGIPLALILILSPWITSFLMGFTSPDRAIGIGILCSISGYLLIVAVVVKLRWGRFPKEMIPAILTFAFSPLVLIVENPLMFIGYAIMTTYCITALIYLIKAIGVVEG